MVSPAIGCPHSPRHQHCLHPPRGRPSPRHRPLTAPCRPPPRPKPPSTPCSPPDPDRYWHYIC